MSNTNFIEDGLSMVWEKYGAFFAFSNAQFDEKAVEENMPYVSLMAGLICPKKNVTAMLLEMDEVIEEGKRRDLEANGPEEIILRELYNHEVFYTQDLHEPNFLDSVEGYEGITDELIRKVYDDNKAAAWEAMGW